MPPAPPDPSLPPLSWFASTTEGARLGELASRTASVARESESLWLAPLEPLRWTIGIGSVLPHGLHVFLAFAAIAAAISLTVSLGRLISSGLASFARAVVALFVSVFVTLVGLQVGMAWSETAFSNVERWVVPPGSPYVLANLHAHSAASGGMLMPEEVVRWHAERGYRVLALTDTNTSRGVERAVAYARQHHPEMIVVSGEEFRGSTHILMLGGRQDISSADTSLREAVQMARHQGAVTLAAHAWTGDNDAADLVAMGVQGFEITNGERLGGRNMRRLCERDGLPAVGNLDFRSGRRLRAATVLPATVKSAADVLEAIRKANCAAVYSLRSKPGNSRLQASLEGWWRERTSRELLPLGLGCTFWAGVLWLAAIAWRTIPSLGGRPLLRVMLIGKALIALAAASLWWRLKIGFEPRVEWFLACWLMGCPWLWLSCRDVLAETRVRQDP